MKKDFTNTFILKSLNLPIIYNFDTLSNNLGISKKMIYLLSNRSNKYYKSFEIPKKNGTKRRINSPTLSLKLVQKWILEEVLYKIGVSERALAFKKGINGIKENASYHTYSLYTLQLDIKEFFPSISRKRIFYIFKNLGYNNVISNTLSKLCTLNGFLPQGGVTSPYLSNLACYRLDRRLQGLCEKRDIIYTRYADDLTFSSDNKELLKNLFNVIKDILEDEGFELNKSKTRFLSPISHKNITGITIDSSKQLKVNKTLKKKVRAMIHKSIVTGDYKESSRIVGYVSYINSIEEGFKDKILDYINNLIKKDYKYFKSVVRAYNSKKFYNELNRMEEQDFQNDFNQTFENDYKFPIDDATKEELAFYEYQDMLESRQQYLRKFDLIDVEVENELFRNLQSAASLDEDKDLSDYFLGFDAS